MVAKVRSTPHLARSAVEAVSQWRYPPTLLNGEPIEVDASIMVNLAVTLKRGTLSMSQDLLLGGHRGCRCGCN